MNHASLFSGIGGFDLAAEWVGWHNVFHSEVDTFCNKILKYHFPNSISYGNIKETDFTPHKGGVDILTGGFPCQPFSSAGLRNGTDDSRYLWPEMFRAIKEIRPRWVVAENVRGLLSWNGGLVLDTVCTDLENEGYEVWPFLLPACGVNAPHQRYRIWIIAYCSSSNDWRNTSEQAKGQKQQSRDCFDENTASDSGCNRRPQIHQETQSEKPTRNKSYGSCFQQSATDSKSQQSKWCQLEQSQYREQEQSKFRRRSSENSNLFEFANWCNFPTQSPVCSGDDGISGRLDIDSLLTISGKRNRERFNPFGEWCSQSIKAYGNAVVPQIPYMIFRNILDFEKTLKLIG